MDSGPTPAEIELTRDTVAIVLAFHRQDRLAAQALLANYPRREDLAKVIGALSKLITLAIEDLLRVVAEIDQEFVESEIGGTVELALERMAQTIAMEVS